MPTRDDLAAAELTLLALIASVATANERFPVAFSVEHRSFDRSGVIEWLAERAKPLACSAQLVGSELVLSVHDIRNSDHTARMAARAREISKGEGLFGRLLRRLEEYALLRLRVVGYVGSTDIGSEILSAWLEDYLIRSPHGVVLRDGDEVLDEGEFIELRFIKPPLFRRDDRLNSLLPSEDSPN